MRCVELCAGIGGFSLAAEWMGWDVVGHVEIDPFCTAVLKHHWPNALHISDLKDVRGDEFGAVDLICGGLPCQPYSVAGKQRGNDDDRAIWPHARRVVSVARPRTVVFENVAGIVRLALDGWLTDLEALGYACWTVIVPAAAVGAPHRRDRVWVVGILGNSEATERQGSRSTGAYTGEAGSPVAGDALADPQRPQWRASLAGGHFAHRQDSGRQEAPDRSRERGPDVRNPNGAQQGALARIPRGPDPEPARDRSAGNAPTNPNPPREQQSRRIVAEIGQRTGDSGQDAANATPRGPRCGPASWPAGLPARAGQDADAGRLADHANGGRHGEPERAVPPWRYGPERTSVGARGKWSDAADSGSIGPQGEQSGGTAPRATERGRSGNEAQPGLGAANDGLSGRIFGGCLDENVRERHDSEQVSKALPRNSAVSGVRINAPSTPPPSELSGLQDGGVPLPAVSCEGRSEGRVTEGEAREDVPNLRKDLLELQSQPGQNMLQGVPLSDGTTERREALESRGLMDPRWNGDPMNAFGPDWEDGVPRVTAGCENRVQKLKALGNALVPQAAYQIFRAIESEP